MEGKKVRLSLPCDNTLFTQCLNSWYICKLFIEMLFINVEIFTRSVKNNDKIERLVCGPKEASFKGTRTRKLYAKWQTGCP